MAVSSDQSGEQAKAYGRVVAKAWTDESFKQRLLSDTAAVLNEHGIVVPDGMQVQVHEANDTVAHLVLPPKPEGLSDEQLGQVAGGMCGTSGTTPSFGYSGTKPRHDLPALPHFW